MPPGSNAILHPVAPAQPMVLLLKPSDEPPRS
jgi:hypothetical protein